MQLQLDGPKKYNYIVFQRPRTSGSFPNTEGSRRLLLELHISVWRCQWYAFDLKLWMDGISRDVDADFSVVFWGFMKAPHIIWQAGLNGQGIMQAERVVHPTGFPLSSERSGRFWMWLKHEKNHRTQWTLEYVGIWYICVIIGQTQGLTTAVRTLSSNLSPACLSIFRWGQTERCLEQYTFHGDGIALSDLVPL